MLWKKSNPLLFVHLSNFVSILSLPRWFLVKKCWVEMHEFKENPLKPWEEFMALFWIETQCLWVTAPQIHSSTCWSGATFGGGGCCSAFAQGKGHWIGLSCGELQTPHPKGALPLEISLLFIWITGAEMRKGGLMNSRLPGMCKRSLQVCREQLQDCWIIACHSLPSSQFSYIGLLNLWKTDALMHNTHVVSLNMI